MYGSILNSLMEFPPQEDRLVYVFLCTIYYLFHLDLQGQCSSINNSVDEPEPCQKPAISTML